MFFYAAKILWILASPLNALLLLFAAGGLVRIWRSGTGTRLILIAAALFVFFGVVPVGPALVTYLEKQYERPQFLPEKIAGIIVLGGAFNSYISEKTGQGAANDNIDRLITFVELARNYPQARLVFSGGTGDIRQPDRKEADDAKAFFQSIGFAPQNILFESRSRNSFENALNTKALVKPKQREKWIVVTSAYHMPRIVAVFNSLGWGVIPYPSDPRTDGKYRLFPDMLDAGGNFSALTVGIKEVLGTFFYYLGGKSTLPFPKRTDIVFGQKAASEKNLNDLH